MATRNMKSIDKKFEELKKVMEQLEKSTSPSIYNSPSVKQQNAERKYDYDIIESGKTLNYGQREWNQDGKLGRYTQ